MNQYKQHHMSKQELKENKLLTTAVNIRHYLVNNSKTFLKILVVVLVLLVLLVGKAVYDNAREKDASIRLNRILFSRYIKRSSDQDINLVQKQLTRIIRDYGGTPSGARASYHLGMLQYQVNGYLKAIQSFREAAENGTGHVVAGALIGIGDAYTQLNNHKKALASYREVMDRRLTGFAQTARVKYIQVCIAIGRFKEARTELDILKKDNTSYLSNDAGRLEALLKLYLKRAGINLK